MATIRDVAEQAGVSVATVSRTLNGTVRVNPALVERVRAAVDDLQYRPNRAARSLRAHRSTIIGLLISDIRNPFFTELVRGVEDEAQRNGYSLILCNSDENPDKESQYIDVLYAEQVAGAIIVPAQERQRGLQLLWDHNIPVVAVDRRVQDRHTDVVLVDNVRGAREAVTHLLTNGYRRIGLVTGPLTTTTGRERCDGYREALEAAGVARDPALERYGSFKADSGRLLTDELLQLQPPIEALFVANNLLTMGALEALHARNMRVPDDVAVVCFDEMPWAALSTVSLTTVTQPVYDLGSTAASRLFQHLHHRGAFKRQEIVLAPTLCIRSSSRPRPPLMERAVSVPDDPPDVIAV